MNHRLIILFFILFSTTANIAFGQTDWCWFRHKPNTRLDSSIIDSNHIKTINIYSGDPIRTNPIDSLFKTKPSYSISIKDSAKEYFYNKSVKQIKNNKRKIIQIVTLYGSKEFEITYYYNNQGQIKNAMCKVLKGDITEDYEFERITYEYKDNLLFKTSYYNKSINENGTPYRVDIYKYDK